MSACLRVHAPVGETRREGITEGGYCGRWGREWGEGMFPLLVFCSAAYFFFLVAMLGVGLCRRSA